MKSCQAEGTYYAAMGFLDATAGQGPRFCAEDLHKLLRDGHELGSHTFDHGSCRTLRPDEFEQDALKGMRAVQHVTGSTEPHSFAFPYGHVTVRSKRRLGAWFSSCRGIVPGINESPVDLNLLRANSLYSASFDREVVARLMEVCARRRGWLIFYSHDVSERPGRHGCTPSELEGVVRMAAKAPLRIATVGEVVERATAHSCAAADRVATRVSEEKLSP